VEQYCCHKCSRENSRDARFSFPRAKREDVWERFAEDSKWRADDPIPADHAETLSVAAREAETYHFEFVTI